MRLNYDDIDKENIEIAELISKHSEEFKCDKEIPEIDEILNRKQQKEHKTFMVPTVAVACFIFAIFGVNFVMNHMYMGNSSNSFDKRSSMEAALECYVPYSSEDEVYKEVVKNSNIDLGEMDYGDREWGAVANSKVPKNAPGAIEKGSDTVSNGTGVDISDTNDNSNINLGMNEHSNTNIQTEGVDEGDIVKTDGKYIYVLDELADYVSISSVNNGKVNVLSKISESEMDMEASEIYINNDKLIIIGETTNQGVEVIYRNKRADCLYDPNSDKLQTAIIIYDITDRENPIVIKKHRQDGEYISSRINDGFLYTVSTHNYNLGVKEDCIATVDDEKCLGNCIKIPGQIDNDSYTLSTSIEIDHCEKIKDKSVVYGGGDDLYMSNDNMYVIVTSYVKTNPISFENDDEEKADWDQEQETKGDVEIGISKEEKRIKKIFPEYKDKDIRVYKTKEKVAMHYQTQLYKYNLEDGNFEYIACGCTDGRIENNLCVDEEKDYLRLFVTDEKYNCIYENKYYMIDDEKISKSIEPYDYYGDEVMENKVYVLNKDMEVVNEISGIAKGEEIYAARFMGDYGYVVTYEETDPLFTVDFTDMENPKIIGELKMEGFSENLFPFGNGRLLGIGEEDGSIKLDMYGIEGNVAKRLSKKLMDDDYCYDEDENYKDVLLSVDKGYIGFGIEDWKDASEDYCYNYLLYQYTDKGFELLRNIPIKTEEWTELRGIYIGDYLYIISFDNGIYSVKISGDDKVSFVPFKY
ncbi:MAG: hypothetical protein E7254_05555 [Lachnospiraceae bacterium]|nr:hypothetical protein [Lachnospiraceae bacterium]